MGSMIGIHASLAVSAGALLALSLTLLVVSRVAPPRAAPREAVE
jgi:hypothetical protein